METTQKATYELPGHCTIEGTCTCGTCRPKIRDEHGNIDYGMVWSDETATYEPRDCEIAEMRRGD